MDARERTHGAQPLGKRAMAGHCRIMIARSHRHVNSYRVKSSRKGLGTPPDVCESEIFESIAGSPTASFSAAVEAAAHINIPIMIGSPFILRRLLCARHTRLRHCREECDQAHPKHEALAGRPAVAEGRRHVRVSKNDAANSAKGHWTLQG